MERSHTPKGQRARERILAAAERLIAAHGFHGTSMRDVAAAAGLPLATTIYHFAKKEQLYAAVLGEIAAQLDRELDDAIIERIEHIGHIGGASRPADRRAAETTDIQAVAAVDAFAVALVRWMAEHPARVKLLVRELLDNPVRVARASKLPLGPFLERAAILVSRATDMRSATGSAHLADKASATGSSRVTDMPSAEVAVLHVVGGLSYFVAAWPTVQRIVGAARAKRITNTYERDAIAFARRVLGITHEVGDTDRKETDRASRSAVPARRASARSPRA